MTFYWVKSLATLKITGGNLIFFNGIPVLSLKRFISKKKQHNNSNNNDIEKVSTILFQNYHCNTNVHFFWHILKIRHFEGGGGRTKGRFSIDKLTAFHKLSAFYNFLRNNKNNYVSQLFSFYCSLISKLNPR